VAPTPSRQRRNPVLFGVIGDVCYASIDWFCCLLCPNATHCMVHHTRRLFPPSTYAQLILSVVVIAILNLVAEEMRRNPPPPRIPWQHFSLFSPALSHTSTCGAMQDKILAPPCTATCMEFLALFPCTLDRRGYFSRDGLSSRSHAFVYYGRRKGFGGRMAEDRWWMSNRRQSVVVNQRRLVALPWVTALS